MKQDDMISRHLADLSARAEDGGYYVFSEFLSPAEQALLATLFAEKRVGRYSLFGGYEGAERKLVSFGDEDAFGYAPEIPAVWLMIAPASQKFADPLTHRDFLGSLMGLGIRREVLGDIILSDNEGYLFALESIAPYIIENLTQVKHTTVRCQVIDNPPTTAVALPEEATFVVAGERLDAFVAAIYKLSRSESALLIEKGLVALDGKIATKCAVTPQKGAMISVRGYGRFLYGGVCGDTRKGKLRILARVY